jgi:alkylation response protein AidB-like acyl-CoA dehydrogenase
MSTYLPGPTSESATHNVDGATANPTFSPTDRFAKEAAARVARLCTETFRDEAAEWEREGGVPASAFTRLGEAGAFAARWREGVNGHGDVRAGALLARELTLASIGACVAVGTHCEAYFRALARCEYGRAIWQDALAGRAIGALAVSEATGGSRPTNCATRAERHGEGWLLSGHKHYVSNLRAAGDCVVFAQTADRSELGNFTLFVVPLHSDGVRMRQHAVSAARASATGMLDLDGVYVGEERRVGRVGSGLLTLLEMLRGERLMAAVAGLAVAELCFEIALAFTDRREVSGGALRLQQAIAHRLATLASDIAAGRALVNERLAAAETGRITSAEAGQVKLVLHRTAWRVADEAVQMLGGRGFTDETPLAGIWHAIRLGRIGGGTDEIQLELISQSLRPGPLATHPAVIAAAAAAV